MKLFLYVLNYGDYGGGAMGIYAESKEEADMILKGNRNINWQDWDFEKEVKEEKGISFCEYHIE